MFNRGCGILLPIFSLPSDYGIGDLGPSAYSFVDFLNHAHQQYWQILPIHPTQEVNGHSPYSSISAFAGNVLFISPDLLIQDGFLSKNDTAIKPVFSKEEVDYSSVSKFKVSLLHLAFKNFIGQGRKEIKQAYDEFCRDHQSWLDDFALFVVIKEYAEGKAWNEWPAELKNRDKRALKEAHEKYKERIFQLKFYQFIFYRQWSQLRNYCAKRNVVLIGDIPIYVNDDSVEVWRYPELFKLNKNGDIEFVGGVPPDYFSQTGQRWGNPIYNWDVLKESQYAWWLQRIKHNLKLYDYIRIDHFRGFAAFWQIPASEKTAVKGAWVKAPGEDLFNCIKKAFPQLPIIAEDLGIITPDVTELMAKFHLPGMKVLLFAFGDDLKKNPYLPHNYTENCVVYTGTHDNNTIQGWFLYDASDYEKKNLSKYLGKETTAQNINQSLIDLALLSKANLAIIPMQDILGLGREARMNIPGTIQGNWQWRVTKEGLNQDVMAQWKRLTQESMRG